MLISVAQREVADHASCFTPQQNKTNNYFVSITYHISTIGLQIIAWFQIGISFGAMDPSVSPNIQTNARHANLVRHRRRFEEIILMVQHSI